MPFNVTFAGKDASGTPANNPVAEQLAFFANKLNLPTERYDDIMKSAHDRAFIVAGAANADLLNDLNAAIRKAIEEGRGLEAFRKDFNSLVLKNGWTGWTGEGTAAGQAWRTNIIYQTNMATSYAAGRWKQLNDPGLLAIRPYWRYVHADGVMHPRPVHVSWHGLVLRHDNAFWLTNFPPNGWLCHCRVTSADEDEFAAAQAAGLGEPPAGWDTRDPRTGTLVGIDRGFDYAPGANVDQPLKKLIDEKLIKLDAPIGSAMYDAMRPQLLVEQQIGFNGFVASVLANPAGQGRAAVIGAIDPATLEWLATTRNILPATSAIAVSDSAIAALGDHLSAGEWAALPGVIDRPSQVLVDVATGRLMFVGETGNLAAGGEAQVIAAELDYQLQRGTGGGNPIVAVFKMLKSGIREWIEAGLYQVLK